MSTMLRKVERFAPSRNPYWFNVDDVLAGANRVRVRWVSRKNGRSVVTSGTYLFFPYLHGAEFPSSAGGAQPRIEAADTRYGGDWEYRWDGERFQENPTAPVRTPDELAAIRQDLDELLVGLPGSMDRPGWEGPYCKTGTN